MRNFNSIVLDALDGVKIHDSIKEAIELAKYTNDLVEFVFNGINVKVDGNSNYEQIYKNYFNNLTNMYF